ncbi:hypothetical protein ACFL08_03175 [Patescibacteria group bacterium]
MSEVPLLLNSMKKRFNRSNILLGLGLVLTVCSVFYIFSTEIASGAQITEVDKGINIAALSIGSEKDENSLASHEEGEDLENTINEYFGLVVKDQEKAELEEKLYEMVAGHPIEEMVPYIAEYDKEIAGLIVGIGKKESNWGKRSPLKDNGETCYNYWGYKGAGTEGVAMGHGCFGTPEEAVGVIGKRIQNLADQEIRTPSEMIVWKCGRSCAGHAPGSADKWISDVSIYYNRIMTF